MDRQFPRPRAVSRAVLPLLPVLLGLTALTACEPSQPDRSSWRDDAYYAVTDVSSDVSTAYLVVRQLTQQRIFGNYAQVALVTAEDDAGKKSDKFGKAQPPVPDIDRYHRVTSALSDAGDLLSDVRIAVVRRQTSAYPRLIRQLDQERKKLDRLTSDLGGLRGAP